MTINVGMDACVFVPPESTIEVTCEDTKKVKVVRFDEIDNYAIRELNLFDILRTIPIEYLDTAIKMYLNHPLLERAKILDKLPWTGFGSDFFVREFISAVNPDDDNVIPEEEG